MPGPLDTYWCSILQTNGDQHRADHEMGHLQVGVAQHWVAKSKRNRYPQKPPTINSFTALLALSHHGMHPTIGMSYRGKVQIGRLHSCRRLQSR